MKPPLTKQRIIIGNSEKMNEVEDKSVDLFITSPPYWNLKKYGHLNEIGQSSYSQYLDRLNNVWEESYRIGKEDSVLVININSRRFKKVFYPIAFDIAKNMKNWKLWDHVIWYIPNALPQPNHYIERLLDNKYESCLVFLKGDPDKYTFNKPRVPQKYITADPRQEKKNPKGRCMGNIIRIPAYRPPNVKELSYHVAAYPEELAAFFIQCYTNVGGIVLDPFLGSGTTLKVARIMNRNGIGYEINPKYKGLIEEKINENWEIPDWKDLDILHSSSTIPGMNKPRKAQFNKNIYTKCEAIKENQDSFLFKLSY